MRWPKANDAASYKEFDNDVAKVVSRVKGNTHQKLDKLAEVVYEEGKKRFGLEADGKKAPVETKVGPSRREVKIAELRKEKKRLRTRLRNSSEK